MKLSATTNPEDSQIIPSSNRRNLRKYVPTIAEITVISFLTAIFVFALIAFFPILQPLPPHQSIPYSATLLIQIHCTPTDYWRLYIDDNNDSDASDWIMSGYTHSDWNFSFTYYYYWSGNDSKKITVIVNTPEYSADYEIISITDRGIYSVNLSPIVYAL
jgi:hypothetical protein